MKAIILIGLLLLVGCTSLELEPNCNEAKELSTGNWLVIRGYKAELNYSNTYLEYCCCDRVDLRGVCVCGRLEEKRT